MAYLIERSGTWYIGYREGRREIRKSLNTTSKSDANLKLKEWEAKQLKGGSRLTNTPVAEVVETYLVHVKQTLAPRTYKDIVMTMRSFFGQIVPALKFDFNNPQQAGAARRHARRDGGAYSRVISKGKFEAINTRDISDWLRDMTTYRRWSPVTSKLQRSYLSGLWHWSIKTYGLRRTGAEVEVNPVQGVQTYTVPAPMITWLNQHQIVHQLTVLEDHPQVQRMVATYIYSGLRLSELLHLQCEDVNLDRKLLIVRRKEWGAGEWWEPKRKRNRAIPISSALLPYLRDQANESRIVKDNWFFPSPDGFRWNEHNFGRRLRAINNKPDVKLKWSAVDFRHSFASALIQKGESAEHIAKLMGNSADVVRKHYGALLTENMAHQVEFHHSTVIKSQI